MDTHLRMIANPYLLRKSEIKIKNIDIQSIENNDSLYRYLETKYKDIYINPILFYNIINKIDESVLEYEIDTIVRDIIKKIIANSIDNSPGAFDI